MSGAYYNENDPFAAQWLRNLIAAGHIAPGDVDDRSIVDVRPGDLAGYTQCHFFAGIGVWSYALRAAGWADHRRVWTGSCPCQPFSCAGARAGFTDDRHLWPVWFGLARRAKPRDVPLIGEQVASGLGLAWLDAVLADLEGEGYPVGTIDLCAAGVGAPHIRQRVFFVADAGGSRIRDCGRGPDARAPVGHEGEGHQRERLRHDARHGGEGAAGYVADATLGADGRLHGRREDEAGAAEHAGSCEAHIVGDAGGEGLPGGQCSVVPGARRWSERRAARESGRSFWADADWLACRDGKSRPVEPGTFPLAHGAPARVGRLRAYGNAINAEAAIAFLEAWLDVRAAA